MLLDDQGQPFPPSEFLVGSESEAGYDLAHVFALFVKNSGEDRNAVPLQNPVEFGEQADNQFSREIPH